MSSRRIPIPSTSWIEQLIHCVFDNKQLIATIKETSPYQNFYSELCHHVQSHIGSELYEKRIDLKIDLRCKVKLQSIDYILQTFKKAGDDVVVSITNVPSSGIIIDGCDIHQDIAICTHNGDRKICIWGISSIKNQDKFIWIEISEPPYCPDVSSLTTLELLQEAVTTILNREDNYKFWMEELRSWGRKAAHQYERLTGLLPRRGGLYHWVDALGFCIESDIDTQKIPV